MLINEFSSRGGHQDVNGKDCDWIEIINASDKKINLSSFFISDNIDKPQKWKLPNEIISSNELIVIYLSGEDASPYHANFKLSNKEVIALSNIIGRIIDYKDVSTDLSRVSEGRSSNLLWGYFNNPTP